MHMGPTKTEPQFLKINVHSLFDAFSLFESTFSHLHRQKKFAEEKTIGKKYQNGPQI